MKEEEEGGSKVLTRGRIVKRDLGSVSLYLCPQVQGYNEGEGHVRQGGGRISRKCLRV